MPDDKTDDKTEETLTLDKKTIDVLVANIIPTSRYFEARFDHMQEQMSDFKNEVKNNFYSFRSDVDRRFNEVNTRFEQVDKRFEQVDKRFEQVDKRFEQMIASIDRLADKLDYRDEKQRGFTIRMFTIAISISVLGVLGVFLKSIGII